MSDRRIIWEDTGFGSIQEPRRIVVEKHHILGGNLYIEIEQRDSMGRPYWKTVSDEHQQNEILRTTIFTMDTVLSKLHQKEYMIAVGTSSVRFRIGRTYLIC